MDKRQYVARLHTLETLPMPGTILYPPEDKVVGLKLLRYEIGEEDMQAVVELNDNLELNWTLKQVKQCTWNKFK